METSFPSEPAPPASAWLAATCYAQATRAAFPRRVWIAILPTRVGLETFAEGGATSTGDSEVKRPGRAGPRNDRA